MDVVIPNISLMNEFVKAFSEEFDISTRLERYEKMNQDLIKFSSELGLMDPEKASQALFIADFVVTSSEITAGASDEERRKSIINAFLIGLESRTTNSEAIMQCFYLSHKVSTTLKRNLSFLAGRGLDLDSSKIIMKDLFITPYIGKCKELLGKGNYLWELGLLASALKHDFPDKNINFYMETGSKKSYLETILMIISEFYSVHQPEINDTIVLPNLEESSMLLIKKGQKQPFISGYYTKSVGSDELNSINELINFFDKSDDQKSITYIRGKIAGSKENIIVVRSSKDDGKPMILLKTPADDINVSEALTLLHQRSIEGEDWKDINYQAIDEITYSEELVEQDPIEVEEVRKKTITVENEPQVAVKSEGFFSKIFSIFKKKESPSKSSTTQTKEIDENVRVMKKQDPKLVRKENRKTKGYMIPAHIAKGLAAIFLGDLRLFEVPDSFRETDYLIVGSLESNFKTNKTIILTEEGMEDPNELANLLDGVDQKVEDVLNKLFGGDNQIIPTEMLFLSEQDKRFLITFDATEDRLVGTIATTYKKDLANWQNKENDEPVKRRTLKMRTGQLIQSLVHTPFDTSVERIYGGAINKRNKVITLERAILSLDN
jgi:hypothetical protein